MAVVTAPTAAPSMPTTVPGVQVRVAPTQKIQPDGRVDPHSPQAPQDLAKALTPARSAPPSMPPPMGAPQPGPNRVHIPAIAATEPVPRVTPPAPIARPSPQPSSPPPTRSAPGSGNAPATMQQPRARDVNGSALATAPRPAPAAVPAGSVRGSQSRSLAPPRGRNWGLIVFVFLIDLGLATAGLLLLQRGLVRDDEVPVARPGASP
jgi:hypothetical protein